MTVKKPSSMRESVPCLRKPAGIPSACRYVTSFIFRADSRATG